MTDIVVSPVQKPESRSNAAGWIIALALLLGVAFFGIFVWPGVQDIVPRIPSQEGQGININVQLPADSIPHPEVPITIPQAPDPSAGVQ
jgi:hypothetical protein